MPALSGDEQEKAYASYYTEYNGKTTKEWGKYILTKKLTTRKSSEIVSDSTVYLKNGASLIIRNGAKLRVSGTLVIEQGAKLYISDGKLDIGFLCQNFGKLVIKEKGTLTVSGIYKSNAFSRITLGGKAYFGKASLSDILGRIKKQDEKFAHSGYCVHYFGSLDLLAVYCCIGNAVTDYLYTLTTTDDPGSLEAENFDKDRVYDTKVRAAVKKAVKDYIAENEIREKLFCNKYLFRTDVTFSFSFETGKLGCADEYYEFVAESTSLDDIMLYDRFHEDTIKL